jgi:hypothetical protein
MSSEGTLIELDGRRRASFGRVGRPEHTRYLVSEQEDGTLVLTPAAVVSELEARFLRDPSLLARIEDARRHPERLRRRRRTW